MTESMVERVAKGLPSVVIPDDDMNTFRDVIKSAYGDDPTEKAVQLVCISIARAAIEAMREHTLAMDAAGYEAYPGSLIKDGVDHLDIYRAMIAAALENGNAHE